MHTPQPPRSPRTPRTRRRRRIGLLGAGVAALGAAALAAGCGSPTPAKTPDADHGSAGRHTASASPSPRSSTSRPGPKRKSAVAADKPAGARSVTMIGDSITVRSEDALWNLMPNAKINGEVGRQLNTAPGLVAEARRSGDLGQVLVIALGTNGNGGTPDLNRAIDAAGPHHKVVLVNIDADRPWESTVNADIQHVAASRSNVTLADWHHTISGKEYLLVDGVHPNPEGSGLFAHTVVDAVNRADGS
ncbi:MAG: hypothetical protein WCA46_30955 [Actinocatenispora sp.]